jgi:integrase
MVGRDIWEVVSERARLVGAEGISPHSFRAAFLTFGKAPLDARQDAAGHSDSATTRLYDRQWRGRQAFEMMPEAEDMVIEKKEERDE